MVGRCGADKSPNGMRPYLDYLREKYSALYRLSVRSREMIELSKTSFSLGFPSLADGLDDARFGACVVAGRVLVPCPDHLVVLCQRCDRLFRHHVHDFVATRLELAQQFGHGLGRGVLEIMHQQNALAVLDKLGHRRFDHVFRSPQLEIEGVDIG